ncbi:DUF1501 domain-containing protein [Granulicella paludicola]|uniref:DUF1501 domain-containing protein n=1 Tax=Granulicella paludicola TaxID=474951 RepID=UPI0021DF4529|nr:DUF1501 domain-containing protein [Granulicella paludicola]
MQLRRRSFIKYASLAAAGNLAGMRPFGALNALAATTPDYKALVCIFLYGGNDANNMVIPTDTAGYGRYSSVRTAGGSSIALAQNTLLGLNGVNYGLHPSLPEIQSLYNSGAAALITNVGTLTQPLTKAQYQAGTANPSNLYSHPDQQEEWQNAAASGVTTTGWAGRVSDVLSGSYNTSATIPMVTSVAGDTLFCNGVSTTPVSVSPGNLGGASCSEGSECSARQTAAQSLITFNSGVSLITADDHITSNAYSYAATLTAATKSVTPLTTVFPATGLGAQLKQISQIIQVRAALGVQRQIFFCGIGNFDTHSNQVALQASLLSQISPAMLAFYNSTTEMGIANQVTSFTMSDFARTFQPNSNTGTDHAWGSHHIVFGGAVKGGSLYGTFPSLVLGGTDDSGTNGRWIPSTGSVQYAATLASWFGVPANQLATVFPNIGTFATANLGFV